MRKCQRLRLKERAFVKACVLIMLVYLDAVRHLSSATRDLVTLPEVRKLSTEYVSLCRCGSALALCHKGLSDPARSSEAKY